MITGQLSGSCVSEYKMTSAELGRVLAELLYRSAALHQLDFQGEFKLQGNYTVFHAEIGIVEDPDPLISGTARLWAGWYPNPMKYGHAEIRIRRYRAAGMRIHRDSEAGMRIRTDRAAGMRIRRDRATGMRIRRDRAAGMRIPPPQGWGSWDANPQG